MDSVKNALIKSIAYMYECIGELAEQKGNSRNIVTLGQCAEQLEDILKVIDGKEITDAAIRLLTGPKQERKPDVVAHPQ